MSGKGRKKGGSYGAVPCINGNGVVVVQRNGVFWLLSHDEAGLRAKAPSSYYRRNSDFIVTFLGIIPVFR